MKILGSPAGVAGTALLLALAAHPALASMFEGPSRMVVVIVCALLFLLAVLLRAVEAPRTGAIVLALGALVAVGGAAFDALRGHEGSLVLAAGQGAQAFQERGPGGARLGARPLGAQVSLDSLVGAEAVLSVKERGVDRREALSPRRAARVGAFHLGWNRLVPHTRLEIAVMRGDAVEAVLIANEEPGVSGDLQVELERYFPDFALDEKNNPFSRSDEPRNPAALLRVYRGERSWRVFVLRSMPGVHQVAEIGARFALREVIADPRLDMSVTAQPAAPFLAVGIALMALGLALEARR